MITGSLADASETIHTESFAVETGTFEIVADGSGHRIDMAGFNRIATPGNPMLPVGNYCFALPPGARVLDVTVTGLNPEIVPGVFDVFPAPPAHILCETKNPGLQERNQEEWRQNREEIYGSDRGYPEIPCRLITSGTYREYAYVSASFCPFTYHPQSKRLMLYRQGRITVTYSQADVELTRADPLSVSYASRLFTNFTDVKDLYHSPKSAPNGPSNKKDYLILTAESLMPVIEATGFISWKESLGYHVKTVFVTDPDIVSQPGRDPAEQIRNYLRSVYSVLGVKYLLIIGDVETVPMRYCYPDASNHTNEAGTVNPLTSGEVPTDHYYADLSLPDALSWDSDGDGFHGEFGEDEPDFLAEISVGRIPTRLHARVTYTLEKIVNFESDRGEWKTNALHGGAILFFEDENHSGRSRIDGARYPHHIETTVMDGWNITHQCEKEGLDTSEYDWDAISEAAFNSSWRNGQYAVVNWAGHGWSNGVGRMVWHSDDGDGVPEYGEISSPFFMSIWSNLEDDYPSIVTAVSCLVGYPEVNSDGRLGVDLLTKSGFGAAAGIVSSTRPAAVTSLFPDECGGAEGITYEFNRYLINGPAGPEKTGDALYRGKYSSWQNFTWNHWYDYLNMYNYNYYGDPAMAREGAEPLPPCETGVTLWMPDTHFCPGDTVSCQAELCNQTGETMLETPLFVLLNVYGEYFFAPSFSTFDCYTLDIPTGESSQVIVPEFTWPIDTGSAENITWLAVLTNPQMSALIGEINTWTFGWSPE